MATQAHRRSFRAQSLSPDEAMIDSWNRPEILLVEDGTGTFEEIGTILLDQGFQVLLAPDAATAMEEIANYRVDVVIVGASRRDFPGLKVLDLAKTLNPKVITVVLTRGYGCDLPVEAYEAEIDCYLGWPVLPGDLGRRLMNLLAGGRFAESPKRTSPRGMVDQQVWFLLGRFVYEVWNSLNEVKDSMGSLAESQAGQRPGTTAPQFLKLSRTINRMTDMVQRFIQETPWPENLAEPLEDDSEYFQA